MALDVYFPCDLERVVRALYSTNHQTAEAVAADPESKEEYLRAFDNALGGLALAFGLASEDLVGLGRTSQVQGGISDDRGSWD